MPVKRTLTIVLAAILLALVAAGGIMYVLTSREGGSTLLESIPSFTTPEEVPFVEDITSSYRDITTGPAEGEQPQAQQDESHEFNLGVLQRSDFAALDTTLLQRGLLPLRPPLQSGKPNPFL